MELIGCILRSKVALRANHPSIGYVGVLVVMESLQQTEIGDLSLEIFIQQDVGRLHVPMNETLAARFVQILKPCV